MGAGNREVWDWGHEVGEALTQGLRLHPYSPVTLEPLLDVTAPADSAPAILLTLPDLGPGSWGPSVVGWGESELQGPWPHRRPGEEGREGWEGGRKRRNKRRRREARRRVKRSRRKMRRSGGERKVGE